MPTVKGLYAWNEACFDGVLISHAHIDHYGLLEYIINAIPVYLSQSTKKNIEITQLFKITSTAALKSREFKMYEPFYIGDITIKPFLMDHSAFDAASFELADQTKTVIYTEDFRGHGRKLVSLDTFISKAAKQADILLTEGTMFGRQDEQMLTEIGLEEAIANEVNGLSGPVLFQSSSQNIDRLVSFYKAALKLGRLFAIDIYTANILFELKQLGNHLPYPSREYSNIKVFYPYRLTQKIFIEIGEEYINRFWHFHIKKALEPSAK